MKVLLVHRQNLEIARMPLVQERFLVGRSPHCEVVARAPGISPVHFLVEWIGEGSFNPKSGIWTIYDLTKTGTVDGNALLEGIVLSEDDDYAYGGLKIKIVDAGLDSAHDFKGGISRSLEEVRKEAQGEKNLLEMVFMRRDSHVIERISYLDRKKRGKIKEHIESDYADLKFKWNDRLLKIDAGLPDNCQLLRGAEPVSASGGEAEMVPLREEDFWTVRTPSYSVYLRFVPRIRIARVKEEKKVDPAFWFRYWLIVLGGLGLVMLVYYVIYAGADVPPPPPRIARIEVQDYVPPPPEPEPVIETAKEEPKDKADPIKKPDPKSAVPIKEKSPKEAAAAQAQKKPQKSKAEVGLNSPAPVVNANQVGLLGALKKAPGEGRISADQLKTETTSVEMANSRSGRIAVKTPPSGALGLNTKASKVGASGKDGFTSAATKVSGNVASAGPIARANSKAKAFSLGGGVESAGSGSNRSLGEIGSQDLSVSGGLDKETVRRVILAHRRQIKACYDKQLMLQPNLQGRVRANWVIAPSGRVQTAKSVDNTSGSAPLESCILEVVRTMKFPEAPNGMPTTVFNPWQFTR